MKNILKLALLPICAIALSSCGNNWVSKHNPQNYIKDSYTRYILKIDGKGTEYHPGSEDDIVKTIKEKITKAGKFTNVKENGSKSNHSFTYHVQRNVMMWGMVRYIAQFYYDGYVSVQVDRNTEAKKELPDHYYYKFDAEKAADLYNTVYAYVEMRDGAYPER